MTKHTGRRAVTSRSDEPVSLVEGCKDRYSQLEPLRACVPLRFPHFEKQYLFEQQLGVNGKAYSFESLDCRDWYAEMLGRIVDAVENATYFPVYRMADGEFNFIRGGRSGNEWAGEARSPRNLLRRTLSTVRSGVGGHRSGSIEYGFEEYSKQDRPDAYDALLRGLLRVAQRGILALALHDSPTFAQHVKTVMQWFEFNNVPLHRNNYYHVYSIYALMHGPDRFRLLRGRRVLVATALNHTKRQGIEMGLRAVGVADLQFLDVSPRKALLDVIDLNLVHKPIDIALVGAGIGSATILAQLEPLSVPCLDVGFALTTMGEPLVRWNRPFCVPDDEFDPHNVKFL